MSNVARRTVPSGERDTHAAIGASRKRQVCRWPPEPSRPIFEGLPAGDTVPDTFNEEI